MHNFQALNLNLMLTLMLTVSHSSIVMQVHTSP